VGAGREKTTAKAVVGYRFFTISVAVTLTMLLQQKSDLRDKSDGAAREQMRLALHDASRRKFLPGCE